MWCYLTGGNLFLNPLNWNQIKDCETNTEQDKSLSGKIMKARYSYNTYLYLIEMSVWWKLTLTTWTTVQQKDLCFTLVPHCGSRLHCVDLRLNVTLGACPWLVNWGVWVMTAGEAISDGLGNNDVHWQNTSDHAWGSCRLFTITSRKEHHSITYNLTVLSKQRRGTTYCIYSQLKRDSSKMLD